MSKMSEVNKLKVGAAFDRAAATYDAIARFQHEVGERLLGLLPALAPALRQPSRILDGGCGTGYGASLMLGRWPGALLAGCDLSPDMLRLAAERGEESVCGDLENLPFADESFDLAWSSLALQWCQPQLAFSELRRVLAPGGALVFATLVPGTLHEIDFAFAGIDRHRHVLPFTPLAELRHAMEESGLAGMTLMEETWVTRHADLPSLLATIRGIGANQIGGERRRSMMGKAAWQTAQERYETLRDENGMLPATYRLVFGGAFRR